MAILVTGGGGYIGSHTVLRLLEQQEEVVVLDNFVNASPQALTRVAGLAGRAPHVIEGDVCDAALLTRLFATHRIDAVIHFAGLKAVGESVREPLAYYQVNLSGTLTLLAAMRAAGVHHLIFSSSATVYGQPEQVPLTEASRTGGTTNPYGTSKWMVEQVLRDLALAAPEMALVALRYFNPVGAHPSGRIGEDPRGTPNNLLPYIAQVAVGKLPSVTVFGNDYPTPDGTGVRDYIHVMDLADGHLQALRHSRDRTGFSVWNLGTGRGHSVLEMIDAFRRLSGRDIPYTLAPRRPGDIAECWSDPSRAAVDLKWSATRDLDDMIRDTWRWQSQNPQGYSSE
ncbi:UDP-glucose 4-epimerase GalE [Pantoea sp. 1.19]|uniref:UDP-glucose 4-epimerase GalE n=1 Tax=Pantoea sp. 1.19 TaxID=1925589 RepID=UPI000948B20B|nr:UDP-glucose 4-epimerase GalE [Pantoea sp. 1.19]